MTSEVGEDCWQDRSGGRECHWTGGLNHEGLAFGGGAVSSLRGLEL